MPFILENSFASETEGITVLHTFADDKTDGNSLFSVECEQGGVLGAGLTSRSGGALPAGEEMPSRTEESAGTRSM